jgi:hypothetical protein
LVKVICPTGKAENFSRRDWTRKSRDSLSGKSHRSVGRVEADFRLRSSSYGGQVASNPRYGFDRLSQEIAVVRDIPEDEATKKIEGLLLVRARN